MDRIQLAFDLYEPGGPKGPKKLPIIFSHGFSWNKFVYRHVVRKLCNETGRKVFAVDGRNHGETANGNSIAATNDFVQDTVDFMEDQKIKTADFVCHSSSSVVLHTLALSKPDLVNKIVMVDNLPYHNVDVYKKYFMKYSRYQNQFLKILHRDTSLKAAREKIIAYAPVDKKAVVALHEKIAYDLTKCGDVFTWRRPLESQIAFYFRDDAILHYPAEVYHGEILVMRSEGSEYVTDSGFEEALPYNPKMKLTTIKDSSHLLMFEKTEEFIHEVKKFLDDEVKVEDGS